MKKHRTRSKRTGKSPRQRLLIREISPIDHATTLLHTVCVLAGSETLMADDLPAISQKLRTAIATNNTQVLYGRLMETLSLQGISDHVANTYMARHGRATWRQVERAMARSPVCAKLTSHWSFEGCAYEKTARRCANPALIDSCPLPRHDLRNGRLNQTAYSLFLYLRDVAEGDLVGWIDSQLAGVSCETTWRRPVLLRNVLLGPLRNVFGASDKVLTMALSEILMAAPKTRPLWIETGVSMVAIDTLCHNFLDRTGILARFGARHAYGPSCYRKNGCAEIIQRASLRINAQSFNSDYPRVFPRFVQHAIWRFCAQQALDICNGNRIDDRKRCVNRPCPLFHFCDRVRLRQKTRDPPATRSS